MHLVWESGTEGEGGDEKGRPGETRKIRIGTIFQVCRVAGRLILSSFPFLFSCAWLAYLSVEVWVSL